MKTNIETEGIGSISWEIESSRQRVNLALNEESLFLDVSGPCTFRLQDIVTMDIEAASLKVLPTIQPGLVAIQRDAIWKPRSDPNANHGIESTDPLLAFEIIRALSDRYAIASMEFGSVEQVVKYANLLSFAWIGARSKDETELMKKAATFDRNLPLGIKNGLDGDIDHTLQQIEMLRRERGEDAAEIVLIYRGGGNAKTPDEWEQRYIEAVEATDGKIIGDTAHGGEMAHDPNREYAKTKLGQMACTKHMIDLAKDGIVPAGKMSEASGVPRFIDPNMPFKFGYAAMREMASTVRNKE